MSLESPETSETQTPHNESFNRSSTSSPANSENLENSSVEPSESQVDVLNQTKMYKCKQCVFICMNKEDYWLHQRQMHIKPEKLLECSKCQFVTEYKHHLEYHLRNHMGSKPYKCSQCEYACVNLSMLRSHLKSHSKAIQYNCAECSYSTKYYNSLKAHMEKFNHTCSASTKATMSAASMSSNMAGGKSKNQEAPQKTSSSSSSSTCSSSSFNSTSFDAFGQSQKNNVKPQKKQQMEHVKDGSVHSSNSSVSSTSSSLSSSPNWSAQLNINPNVPSKQASSHVSPNFNPAAALAAAALAYQSQQQQTVPNFLLNPSLFLNTQNLGNLISTLPSDTTVSPNSSQFNCTNSNSSNNASNLNSESSQFNIIQQQIQLQMALAMAASTNQFQSSQNGNQFANILSDLYVHQQQKSQQDQLLLAASFLHQQQPTQEPTNKKRSLDHSPDEANPDGPIKPFKCHICKSKFENKKDLKRHNRLNHKSLESEEQVNQQEDNLSEGQLHECFKCELIFRNYEMYCAHKMLHDMQEQKGNGDADSMPEEEQIEQLPTDDLNHLLAQRLFAEHIQQSLLQQQGGAENFSCNQCGLKCVNALQYFLHVQTYHNNSDTQAHLGSISNAQDIGGQDT